MLDVGDAVPDFTLPLAYADGRRDPVSFHELLRQGSGPVVVGFFPLAFTRTCTTQMCEMRDQQAAFDTLGARAVGFSIDTAPTNVHFARMHGLQHPIFSDANREVVHRIWETQTVLGVRDVAKRGFLVVAADGRVAARWITDTPGEWVGVKAVEEALARAK